VWCTIGLMTWLLMSLPGTYERTTANFFARFASLGNDEPNVTPGSAVAISPVTLRTSSGALIFGSKVSNCG
jgi:hypothetical protein